MKNISIYVHIPFCAKKCKYCDFCSFKADKNFIIEYFDVLKKECKKKSDKNKIVKTIYFGGGTPSSVDEKFICQTLNEIRKNFVVDEKAEITIECNPCSVTKEKLVAYKNAGINRISFGVQSFDDKVLLAIGRLHNGEQAERAICLAKEVGFQNISCDIMLGIPFQTDKILESDLKKIIDLDVQHVSCYTLQLEENTPLYQEVKRGMTKVDDDDNLAKKYQKMQIFLKKHDFFQYEVSNFAKNNMFSKHNLNYWERGEYIGLGLSAHSFINETRIANSKNFEEYKNGIVEKEKLAKQEIVEELIMLGLRCFKGIDLCVLKKFGVDLLQNKSCQKFLKQGILQLEDNKLRLKEDYYELNNAIIVELFS